MENFIPLKKYQPVEKERNAENATTSPYGKFFACLWKNRPFPAFITLQPGQNNLLSATKVSLFRHQDLPLPPQRSPSSVAKPFVDRVSEPLYPVAVSSTPDACFLHPDTHENSKYLEVKFQVLRKKFPSTWKKSFKYLEIKFQVLGNKVSSTWKYDDIRVFSN